MNNNYKRPKQKKRDLKNIENIHRISTPRNRPTQKVRNSQIREVPPRKRKPVKKKRRTFFPGRIIFLIVFIIGVIYIISIVIDTIQKPVISYQTVQRGMIDNSEVFSGLVVRSEKVISNQIAGNMYLIAGEGEKVKKDGQVYQVFDSDETLALEQDIEQVESNIEKVQNKRQDISYYQNEIQDINKTINNHMEEFYVVSKPGQLSKTHNLKKQIEYEIRKRKNIHMKDASDALSPLKDKKQDLTAQLKSNQTTYRAPEPGIISYYIDGLEEDYTFETIDKISEKDITGRYVNKKTTADPVINNADPAYKIINSEKWYMVCFMPELWASKFEEDETYDFILMDDNNSQFSLKVEENILKDDKYKVVFSSREQLELFSTIRTASFKSVQYIYEGLKIPKSAIIERNLIKIPLEYFADNENGIGLSSSDIEFQDDAGYAYVFQNLGQKGTIKLGDAIANPLENNKPYIVSEVSTEKGVYVVNGRITKFKQLDILAENEKHAIVKSGSINGLKQFDQIITNPKNVEEEQLLKNMDIKNINN